MRSFAIVFMSFIKHRYPIYLDKYIEMEYWISEKNGKVTARKKRHLICSASFRQIILLLGSKACRCRRLRKE